MEAQMSCKKHEMILVFHKAQVVDFSSSFGES
jgi:hypothetical protein